MSNDTSWSKLSHDLDAVSRKAAEVLRDTRIREAAARGFDAYAALLFLALPALYLGGALFFGYLLGIGMTPWPVGWVLAVGLVPPIVYIVAKVGVASSRQTSRAAALATVDELLGLQDRLATANEFLEREDRTPFMEAAVADAVSHAEYALGARVEVRANPYHAPRRVVGLFVLGIAVLIGALLVDPSKAFVTDIDDAGPNALASADIASRIDDDETDRPDERKPRPEAEEKNEPPRDPGDPAASNSGKQRGDLSKDAKKTEGKTQAGQSSNAASASGSSESRGAPSSQGQSSKGGDKKAKKKKPKKKKKPTEAESDRKRKPEEDSGATAGRGAASGSNKSPAASEWSSRDQVTSEDEEDLEDDEEVDDEFDDSDARGGLQPNLRDRKPPVNRDLSIGFGNQKDPDANGRGGAGEQKKSRGVASLVLGVPIPDHVKGRPNPGKTKVTQERVEPRAEDFDKLDAAARQSRDAPVGHLTRQQLEPWMRELLRTYYLSIRGN